MQTLNIFIGRTANMAGEKLVDFISLAGLMTAFVQVHYRNFEFAHL